MAQFILMLYVLVMMNTYSKISSIKETSVSRGHYKMVGLEWGKDTFADFQKKYSYLKFRAVTVSFMCGYFAACFM